MTAQSSSPERHRWTRRVRWLLWFGLALLVLGISLVWLISRPNHLSPAATGTWFSFAASVLLPLGFTSIVTAIVALLALRDFREPLLLVFAATCAIGLAFFATRLFTSEDSNIKAQGARIVGGIYKAPLSTELLGAPRAIVQVEVTIIGPQTAVAVLPILALPLLLLWPRRKPDETDPSDTAPRPNITPA